MKVYQMVATVLLLIRPSANAQKAKEMLREAQHAYDSGNYADAEKRFIEITHAYPDEIPAQMYLGQTLFKENKFAASIVPYEKVRILEKAGMKLTLTQHRILGDQLAMAYGISGRTSDSKSLLRGLIRIDPAYPLNYYNLACIAADEKDRPEVFRNLTLAFKHRAQVLSSEQMPDPALDPSFKKYANDSDFKTLLVRLNR